MDSIWNGAPGTTPKGPHAQTSYEAEDKPRCTPPQVHDTPPFERVMTLHRRRHDGLPLRRLIRPSSSVNERYQHRAVSHARNEHGLLATLGPIGHAPCVSLRCKAEMQRVSRNLWSDLDGRGASCEHSPCGLHSMVYGAVGAGTTASRSSTKR